MLIINKITKIPRYIKQFIVVFCDAISCILAVWLGLFLRLDKFIPLTGNLIWAVILSIIILLPIFWFCGIYSNIFRFSGKAVLISILSAITFYGIIYFVTLVVHFFYSINDYFIYFTYLILISYFLLNSKIFFSELKIGSYKFGLIFVINWCFLF